MESASKMKDLMHKDFAFIKPDATIHEAVQILSELDCRSYEMHVPGAQSLVVVDDEGQLVGIITMLDILKGIEPAFMRETEHLAALTWDGLFAELVHQAENRTVEEAMTPAKGLTWVDPDDRLMTAVELMVSKGIRRIPVLEEGKVVGVVRLYDIFHEVAREMLKKSGES